MTSFVRITIHENRTCNTKYTVQLVSYSFPQTIQFLDCNTPFPRMNLNLKLYQLLTIRLKPDN